MTTEWAVAVMDMLEMGVTEVALVALAQAPKVFEERVSILVSRHNCSGRDSSRSYRLTSQLQVFCNRFPYFLKVI